MKIYTRTGDFGETSLYDQTRIKKNDIRVECYGTVDELNASLGFAKTLVNDQEVYALIERVQRELFRVAGELAMLDGARFPERIGEQEILSLEQDIDRYLDRLGRDQTFKFVIPGTNPANGALHVSRTISRRAERRMISLSGSQPVRLELHKYVNRLSDFIFTLARVVE